MKEDVSALITDDKQSENDREKQKNTQTDTERKIVKQTERG